MLSSRRRALLAAKESVAVGGAGRALRAGKRPPCELAELIPAPVATTNPGKSAIRRKPSAGARRIHALAAENVHRFHGARRSRPGNRLLAHAHAVRPKRAARQDYHPFHERGCRHQQGIPRRACADRRCRPGARCADRRDRPAATRRRGNALASLKEEVAAAKRPGKRNGRSISIPRKCRSINTASSAI